MNRKIVLLVLVSLLVLVASGCATTFQGSAYIDDGPDGCEQKCSDWGMKMAGMIALGDYSEACVCQKPGVAPGQALDMSAGGVGAAVGVMMQQQRQQQQQQQ